MKQIKPITLNDTSILSRLPIGQWITRKEASVMASKLNRLVGFGLLEKRKNIVGVIEYFRPR